MITIATNKGMSLIFHSSNIRNYYPPALFR